CRGRGVALRTDALRASFYARLPSVRPPSLSARPHSFSNTAVLVACHVCAPCTNGPRCFAGSLLCGERGFGAFLCIIDHVHLILDRIRSRCRHLSLCRPSTCLERAPARAVLADNRLFTRHPIHYSVRLCPGVDCTLTGELRRRACDSSCSHSAAVLILSL
ncbi:hypothetical protein DFH09DRAFT_1172197, partial [Mycena vulgaris]